MTLDWLGQVGATLHAYRSARSAYAARLAPGFNVLRYLAPDENCLTRIIGDLLNPTERHGQGALFVTSFLERFWPEVNLATLGQVQRVQPESRTDRIENQARRIDLVVWLDGGVLGIENKPWAGDQPNQVKDYLAQLAREGRPHRLFYLSQSPVPSPQSIGVAERDQAIATGRLKMLSFPDLASWIGDCRGHCRSERVRVFLDDLEAYLREAFEGAEDVSELKAIVDLATKSGTHLEAALTTAYAAQEIKAELLRRLADQFTALLHTSGLAANGWRVVANDTWFRAFSKFWFEPMPQSPYGIALQFDGSNTNSLIYGIEKRHESLPDLPGVRQCLNERHLQGNGASWWVWWRNVEDTYRHWGAGTRPWVGILDGSCATSLFEPIASIPRVLAASQLLDQLQWNVA